MDNLKSQPWGVFFFEEGGGGQRNLSSTTKKQQSSPQLTMLGHHMSTLCINGLAASDTRSVSEFET